LTPDRFASKAPLVLTRPEFRSTGSSVGHFWKLPRQPDTKKDFLSSTFLFHSVCDNDIVSQSSGKMSEL